MTAESAVRSLYVHFPFCESKCHYCDFYSLGRERTQEGDAPQFLRSLRLESARTSHLLAPQLNTIFFGGGTPSMTPASDMARALEPLGLPDRVCDETEWTMEANPSSISYQSLREYRELGVNRISMGVQALRDDLLANLGRVHSRQEALRGLDAIFSAGFDNVSVDLLCGVPGQSMHDLEEALRILSDFPITHLSCYLLTLTKTHKMYSKLPDENTQLAHLLLIDEALRARGFEHYEISNFARPGRRARHNLSYWTGASYLGLGPSAHSYDREQSKRWKNASSIHRYASLLSEGRSPVEWVEFLTEEQKNLEQWMLALRLDEGFPDAWLKTKRQRSKAQILQKEGLLELHPASERTYRLTPRGFALSDQVIASLV